jgi:hypothetical protein
VQLVHTVSWAPKLVNGFRRHVEVVRMLDDQTRLAAWDGLPIGASGREKRMRALVDRTHPRYIYVLSAYLENMAKYRHSAAYRDNYAFCGALRHGTASYRLVERIPVPFPFGFLSPDPEFTDVALYLFERRSEP